MASSPSAGKAGSPEKGRRYKLPLGRKGSIVPKAMQERLEVLKDRIEGDEYDVEAWEQLVSELRTRQQTPEVVALLRQLYEDMVAVFPTSCATWRARVELEMAHGATETVNALFGESLLNIKELDLWRVYIKHVKAMNQGGSAEGLGAIKQAYEFTLDHLGTDIASGPLWVEYILFLQKTGAALLFGGSAPGNEESARLVAIRRAFQRAVTIPTHSLETLWRDYDKFENSVNRQLAKQILNDLQGQYATSRTIYRELKKKWEGVKGKVLAAPPTNKVKDYQQQKLWSRLVAFEKSNPLKLEADSLLARVELVYSQCLLCLRHYPEVWYEYATWHAENDRQQQASEVFKEACKALPTCTILFFAAADFEAAHDHIEEAKAIYEDLLLRAEGLELHTQGQIWIQYMRFLRRTEGPSHSRKLFLRARKSEGCTHHIYSTSALLEWQSGRDMEVAKKIFELGLKSFLKETDYVLEYANFLISQGDISNARTLYERALTVVQGSDAKIIWNEYLKFEYHCGDLGSTLALEKRRKEAMVELEEAESSTPKDAQFSIGLLLLRYNINNMLPCSRPTLRHLQTVGVDEAFYDLPNFTRALDDGSGNSRRDSVAAPSGANHRETSSRKQGSRGGDSSSSLPPAIAAIINKLPLRRQLTGPLPTAQDVDSMILAITNLDFQALKAAQQDSRRSAINYSNGSGGRKRGAPSEQSMPPKHDVYRMRQRQRTKK